jgi:hypothetical protein
LARDCGQRYTWLDHPKFSILPAELLNRVRRPDDNHSLVIEFDERFPESEERTDPYEDSWYNAYTPNYELCNFGVSLTIDGRALHLYDTQP